MLKANIALYSIKNYQLLDLITILQYPGFKEIRRCYTLSCKKEDRMGTQPNKETLNAMKELKKSGGTTYESMQVGYIWE
jgi:hypothetical protein